MKRIFSGQLEGESFNGLWEEMGKALNKHEMVTAVILQSYQKSKGRWPLLTT